MSSARLHWLHQVLRSQAIGNRSIAWFSVIGVMSVVLGLPEPQAIDLANPRWWIIAVASQVVFAIVLIGLRITVNRMKLRNEVIAYLGIIALAGFIRAAVLSGLIAHFNLDSTLSFDNPMRILTSVIVCIMWMSALGLLFQSSSDFTTIYRQLIQQRSQLDAAKRNIKDIPEVLEQWSRIREELILTASRVSAHLDQPNQQDSQALQDAAKALGDALEQQVRPIGRNIIDQEAFQSPARVPFAAAIYEVMRSWSAPITGILTVSGGFVMIASISRAGINGLLFAIEYLVFLWAALSITKHFVTKFPRRSLPISSALLGIFPFAFLGFSVLIGQGFFDVEQDYVGAFLVGIQASAIIVAASLLARMNLERTRRLDLIRLQIDDEVIEILANQEVAKRATVEFGLFIHHSIQSDLTSLAIRLQRAAESGDSDVMHEERTLTKLKLDSLPRQAPWIEARSGATHILDVVEAWRGIAEVTVDLPNEATIDSAIWTNIAYVIEEAITNAVRSGKARKVHAMVINHDDLIELRILDNGTLLDSERGIGAGTTWLDRLAPQAWELTKLPAGTLLSAKFSRSA